jgi:hypothetical protein
MTHGKKIALCSKILSDFNSIEVHTGIKISDKIRRLALKKVWVRPDPRSDDIVKKERQQAYLDQLPSAIKSKGRPPFPQ